MAKFDVEVDIALTGPSGNAYAIMGLVSAAMKEVGATSEDVQQYTREATSGDYKHLLAVSREWVDLVTV